MIFFAGIMLWLAGLTGLLTGFDALMLRLEIRRCVSRELDGIFSPEAR